MNGLMTTQRDASIPATMAAWTFASHGEPSTVLRLAEVPVSVPGPGQVLVDVDAAAVNFADTLIVRGEYQSAPPLPAVAGMEMAGTVVAAGPGVALQVGARVAGLGHRMSGAFADYALLEEGSAFVPPRRYTAVEAAAFTVAYQTAWFAVHVRGRVTAGESVLVHAAAGGVGIAAVQVASAAGARVIGVVGDERKADVAKAAGCDEVLLRGDLELVDRIKEAADGGVDVVIDPVGGSAYAVSERAVRFDGRIVLVGFASGELPSVRPDLVMVKNVAVIGLHWGLYRTQRPRVVAEQYERLVATVEGHAIRPIVSRACSMGDVPAALESVARGEAVGRVVIAVDPARADAPVDATCKVSYADRPTD